MIVPKGEAFVALLERERACVSTERTVDALCEALMQLLDMPEMSASLSARARRLAVREWNQKIMVSRYLRQLHGLAESSTKEKS